MSFALKLPFTRPKKEEKACSSCSFTTRNEVLFQRHVNLCSSSSSSSSPRLASGVGKPTSSHKKTKDPERSRQYSRNYVCEVDHCDFATIKPRQFLQHKAHVHGEKLSIWQCDKCDYASKYRHKLERHTRLVHHSKLVNAVEEFVSTKSKRKPSIVTRIRRVSGGQQQRGIPTAVGGDDESQPPVTTDFALGRFMKTTCNGQDMYLCKVCSYASDSSENLTNHVKRMHSSNVRQYSCDTCDFSSYDRHEYFKHRSMHTSSQDAQFHCIECDYTTDKKRNYERHMASHTKQDGSHKCFYCSFTSSTESAVHRHMGQYHKSKGPIALLITEASGSQGGKEEILAGGYSILKPNIPTAINNNNLSPDAHEEKLDAENRKAVQLNDKDGNGSNSCEHEDEDDEDEDGDEPRAGPGELVCGECGYEARTMKSLLKHLDSHVSQVFQEPDQEVATAHEIEHQQEVHVVSNESQKRPMIEEDRVEVGMKRPRASSEESTPVSGQSLLSLKCTYCSYVAKWPSDLRRHLKVHSMNRRFSCQFCGRMYKYQGDLNVHMKKAHASEYQSLDKSAKSYICPLCSYVTVSKKMYASHFECHPEVEFTCVYCSELHKTYLNMKTHLEYQHAEDLSMEIVPLEDIIDRCLDPSGSISGGSSKESTPMPSSKETTPVPIFKETTPVPASKESTPLPTSKESTPTPREVLAGDPDSSLEKYQIAPGKWKCPRCSYLTHAQSKLRAHLTTHDNIKPFQCGHCGKRSNWKWDVVKHMRSAHAGCLLKPVVEMDIEEAKATIDEYLLANPTAKKAWSPAPSAQSTASDGQPSTPSSEVSFDLVSPIYRCSLCDFEHDDVVQIQLHSRDVHKGLARAFDLRKEQPPAKLYKCSDCGQRSNWKADIRKHIRTKHGEGNAEVIFSGDVEKSPTKLNSKSVPEEESAVTFVEEGTWPFVCSLCEFKSTHKLEVSQHVTNDHKDSNAFVTLQSHFKKDSRPFKCPLCSRRSRWLWDLRKHIRNVHPGSTAVPLCQQYMCSLCTHMSKWHTSIASHLDQEHNGQGEVKVVMGSKMTEQDGKDSSERSSPSPSIENGSRSGVKEEEDVHKVWKCVLCGFSAVEKTEAMQHLVSSHPKHSCPYACKICSQQFNFLSATYRHLRSRHGKNDYSYCRKNLVYVASDEQTSPSTAESLHCALCDFSACKVDLHEHIMTEHDKREYECDKYTTLLPIQTYRPESATNTTKAINETVSASSSRPNLRYQCEHCPYQSNKIGMFKMHKAHHKFTPGNMYKCKFCNYYVCAARLLHQHVRLHLTDGSHYKASRPSPSKKIIPEKRLAHLQCQKCPYYGKTARDLMYHKQFHRPKTTAPFKCNFCDYWVSVKALLQQHVVVHDPDYGKPIPPSLLEHSNDSSSSITIDPNAVETAALKQHLIQSKIRSVVLRTSHSPSPTPSTVDDEVVFKHAENGSEPGFGVVAFPNGEEVANGSHDISPANGTDGSDASLHPSAMLIHQCKYCPYGNPRAVNVRMHEEMHGKKGENRFKCEFCDYHCGNMGLMAHHLKVHKPGYNPRLIYSNKPRGKNQAGRSVFANSVKTSLDLSSESSFRIGYNDKTKRHVLQTSNIKKYCCEKCPFASAKRDQYERHILLHCSRQRYVCSYCDYSVPTHNLLIQHMRLHLLPNKNLLASQSVNNLQELPSVGADVAITSGLAADNKGEPVADTHDHLELFENVVDGDMKSKKLYRCDRCPYTNTSREHLLSHLKSHVIRQEFECPYCDYSVSKVHLLANHVNIHFANNHLLDLEGELPVPLHATASEVNEMKKSEPEFIDLAEYSKVLKVNAGPTNLNKDGDKESSAPSLLEQTVTSNDVTSDVKEKEWVCQFCDRAFSMSEHLVKHEMQHLIGNKLFANKVNLTHI